MFGSNAPPGPWCSSLSSRANASSKGNATPLIDTTGQFIRMPVDETGNFCTPLSTICLADVIVDNGVQKFPDRKSTRLNSSHVAISYAVFCLKKKKNEKHQ